MRSSDWIRNEPKPRVSQVPKSFRTPDVELPENGCHNCANWRSPRDPDKDDFGTCRAVVTLARRIPRGPEKGTCIESDRAFRMGITDYDMMRTRPFFRACQLHKVGVSEIDTAHYGDRARPVQGRLFDQVAERRDT